MLAPIGASNRKLLSFGNSVLPDVLLGGILIPQKIMKVNYKYDVAHLIDEVTKK